MPRRSGKRPRMRHTSPQFTLYLTLSIIGSAAAAFVRGAVEDPQPLAKAQGQDARVPEAVKRGLDWLAAHQDTGGAFGGEAPSLYADPVAVTSLAGLAFLASGSTPDHGPYAKPLDRALQYVLHSQSADTGLIAGARSLEPMYGHGYATLFLAEACMKSKNEAAAKALQKAVDLLAKAQNPEGGWRYLPQPADADVSVTACELNALLAAKAGGANVDAKIIHSAIVYVQKCQNHDGGFSYMTGGNGTSGSGFPRSAAALAALMHAGEKSSDPDVSRGIHYVVSNFFNGDPAKRNQGHYYYGAYYASQWLPITGDAQRKAYDAVADELLAARTSDHWTGELTDAYATASALVVLQAPDQKLWIFRRPA